MDLEAQYRLVYDEVRADIERQASDISETRSTASGALGVAALVGAAASSVAGTEGLGGLGLAALIVFGIAALLVGSIWWPRSWHLAIDVELAAKTYHLKGDRPMTIAEMLEARAVHLEEAWETNRKQMRWLFWALQGAIVAAAATVVLFIVAAA